MKKREKLPEKEPEVNHDRLLFELAKVLHSSLQEQKVSQLVVESFFLIFKASAKVWLQETHKETLYLKASKHTSAINTLPLKKIEAYFKGKPIHYLSAKNEVWIGLYFKNQFLGALEIHLPQGAPLDADKLNLLIEMADLIATALGNAKLYSKIEKMALMDSLTGLFNRIYFQKTLGIEIARAKRHDYMVSLLMIDLDHFKNINDSFGHQIGDEILKRIAHICKHALRRSDIVSRYGGEEFLGVLIGCKGQQAWGIAEKIRLKIAQTTFYLFEFPHKDDIHYAIIEKQPHQDPEWITPISKEEKDILTPYLLALETSTTNPLETQFFTAHRIHITVSIGIACFPEDIPHSSKAQELLNAGSEEKDLMVYMADKALYKAKKSGRNQAIAYHDLQSQRTSL